MILIAGTSEPGRDREGEGMQRDGSTETLVRSSSPRFAEQAAAGADRSARPLLRSAEAQERRRRCPRRHEHEEPFAGGRVAGERKRGAEVGADEDEDVHLRHTEEFFGRRWKGIRRWFKEAHVFLVHVQDIRKAESLPAWIQGHFQH